MTKQASRDELISEIKTLLKRYENEEQSDDERRSSEWNSTFRRANALWLIGEGPVANALQNHLRQEGISAFWAKHFNVSEERFIKWREHHFDAYPQCSKMLPRVGRRCKLMAYWGPNVPNLFFVGISDRCPRHSRDMTGDEMKVYFRYFRDCDQ